MAKKTRIQVTDKGRVITLKGKQPKRKPKANWYKMVALFDNPAKPVMSLEGDDIVLAGWLPPANEVMLCLVPPNLTPEQGLAIEKILEANLRAPVLVLTNNIQLVKLKRISAREGEKALQEGLRGIFHFQAEEGANAEPDRTVEAPEGGCVRAEDRRRAAADLRSDGVAEGDGGG